MGIRVDLSDEEATAVARRLREPVGEWPHVAHGRSRTDQPPSICPLRPGRGEG